MVESWPVCSLFCFVLLNKNTHDIWSSQPELMLPKQRVQIFCLIRCTSIEMKRHLKLHM